MKPLIIITISAALLGCDQNSSENSKPSRSEIISEINNTCYIYANTPGTSSKRYDAVTDFLEFAQADGGNVISELGMSESVMDLNSSLGAGARVTTDSIKANCISKLREIAL